MTIHSNLTKSALVALAVLTIGMATAAEAGNLRIVKPVIQTTRPVAKKPPSAVKVAKKPPSPVKKGTRGQEDQLGSNAGSGLTCQPNGEGCIRNY